MLPPVLSTTRRSGRILRPNKAVVLRAEQVGRDRLGLRCGLIEGDQRKSTRKT